MADGPKFRFGDKRETDAAPFAQAAYALDQTKQNMDGTVMVERAQMGAFMLNGMMIRGSQ